jgi:DNA-binding GntR family transcriptional regulator
MRHRSSLTNQAYDAIKFDVITCAWLPGQQVAKRQLVERYGFGTTPIREALQRLAQEGLVEPIPRFGYVVTPITLSDVREIYELRSILESAALRLAATRATDQQLDQVAQGAHFTYVFGDRHTYSDFLARNAQFHRSIAALAGNERLAEQISRLLDAMTRIFHLGLDLRDSAEEMRNEHLALARALDARNPILAEQTVRDQIARSRERVLEALTGQSVSLGHRVLVEPATQA